MQFASTCPLIDKNVLRATSRDGSNGRIPSVRNSSFPSSSPSGTEKTGLIGNRLSLVIPMLSLTAISTANAEQHRFVSVVYRVKLAGGCVGGPSGVTYAFVIPPSTTKSVPFTKLLSSLARKRTACACSIASPNLPVGK